MNKILIAALFGRTLSTTCLEAEIQWPAGIQNEGANRFVALSNIAYSDTHLYTGGKMISDNIFDSEDSRLNANGIAFLRKDSLKGQPVWFKFYNHADLSQLISIAFLENTSNIFSYFDGGIITIIEPTVGAVIKAKKLSG